MKLEAAGLPRMELALSNFHVARELEVAPMADPPLELSLEPPALDRKTLAENSTPP